GADGCTDPSTILISGGDNFTGPAVSTFFNGEPMAQAMHRMGYAVAVFGNHDFDFGRAQFIKNRARSGVTYVSANMHVEDASIAAEMKLPPFVVVERRGARIAIVGVTTDQTLTQAKASKFKGIDFEGEELAIDHAVGE